MARNESPTGELGNAEKKERQPLPSASSSPELDPTPSEGALNSTLVDGKCTTCKGFTYFSQEMRRDKEKPVCIGVRETLNVPPPPFTFPSEIEQLARAQFPMSSKPITPSAKDSLPSSEASTPETEDSALHYMAIGTTVVTETMKKEGWFPYCTSGMTVVHGGEKKRNGASLAETPGNQGDDSLRGGFLKLFPFFQSPQHFGDHVALKGSQAVEFWKNAPVNFPERYVRFTRRMIGQMEVTAVRTTNFAISVFKFWVPKSERD